MLQGHQEDQEEEEVLQMLLQLESAEMVLPDKDILVEQEEIHHWDGLVVVVEELVELDRMLQPVFAGQVDQAFKLILLHYLHSRHLFMLIIIGVVVVVVVVLVVLKDWVVLVVVELVDIGDYFPSIKILRLVLMLLFLLQGVLILAVVEEEQKMEHKQPTV
jgi:hypothetical protein